LGQKSQFLRKNLLINGALFKKSEVEHGNLELTVLIERDQVTF
jgi:hypothetical protein